MYKWVRFTLHFKISLQMFHSNQIKNRLSYEGIENVVKIDMITFAKSLIKIT